MVNGRWRIVNGKRKEQNAKRKTQKKHDNSTNTKRAATFLNNSIENGGENGFHYFSLTFLARKLKGKPPVSVCSLSPRETTRTTSSSSK